MHHAWSDCFLPTISSHCWLDRLTSSCGLRLLHSFSSAHFLIWCFPIIWSRHQNFFFDKIWLIVGGVGTSDLKMCEFLSLTGFGLKCLVDSVIHIFLCQFWSLTGFGLQFLGNLRICTFLDKFLVFDRIRTRIFGQFGNLYLFFFNGIGTQTFGRVANFIMFVFDGTQLEDGNLYL